MCKFKKSITEITPESALDIIKRQGAIVVTSSILPFVSANPCWAIPFVLGIGLLNAWGEFGAARTKELVQELDKHKDDFRPEILKSEEFKSAFLNVWERQLREVSAQKRKLFRNYLINLGKKNDLLNDYHTKILIVLDQITFEELRIIDAWSGKLQKKWIEKNKGLGYSWDNVNKNMNDLNESQVMFAFEDDRNKPSVSGLVMLLKSLGNYGLLSCRDTSGGGREGVIVKITPFAKKFLEYIHAKDR